MTMNRMATSVLRLLIVAASFLAVDTLHVAAQETGRIVGRVVDAQRARA
jgi:hypothetical protein